MGKPQYLDSEQKPASYQETEERIAHSHSPLGAFSGLLLAVILAAFFWVALALLIRCS